MQGESPGGGNGGGEGLDLDELASRLVVEGMPIQRVIGEEAGVSQSTVSRAIHRLIKGDSPGARQLWEYAEARVRLLQTGEEGGVTGDGTPVRPTPARTAKASAPRERAQRMPRRRRSQGATGRDGHTSPQDLVQQAMQGLRDYLEDRFDPSLVIEQLAVLRRAQDGGRRARAVVRPDVGGPAERP